MKKILKISFRFFVVLFVAIVGISSCASFRKSDKKLLKRMNKTNKTFQICYDSFDNIKFRYLHFYNDSNKPLLIFIHGAPGSATEFLEYMENPILRSKFNLISIDRFGYGYTQYGNYESVFKNSLLVNYLLLKTKTNSQNYLIGHSYGGPISLFAAALSKDTNVHSIMLAPAIDPKNEKYFFGGKLAWWKASRWLFSKAFQVSADEKYNHENDLTECLKLIKDFKGKCLHVHGKKDFIAPFLNLEFSKNNISIKQLTTISEPKKGHIFPFTEVDFTVKTIVEWIEGK